MDMFVISVLYKFMLSPREGCFSVISKDYIDHPFFNFFIMFYF